MAPETAFHEVAEEDRAWMPRSYRRLPPPTHSKKPGEKEDVLRGGRRASWTVLYVPTAYGALHGMRQHNKRGEGDGSSDETYSKGKYSVDAIV